MNIIIISAIVGLVGTGLGGLITSFYKLENDRIISSFLAFAGGVMVSIVFFELIPEAINHTNLTTAFFGVIIGIVFVMGFNTLVDRWSGHDKNNSELHGTYEEFYHEDSVIYNKNNMVKSGVLMFIIMCLHSFPEGLAIGAADNHNPTLSITLAIMLGLHNIPEGMAIAAPLISGGVSRVKAIMLSVLAGLPLVIGCWCGVLIGTVSDTALAWSFAVSGGAMLYAVFGEILPQSIYLSKSRIPTIVLLISILLGMLISKM